jgi:hypothetical protein
MHPSTLHGQAHVTRVMVHAIRLVELTAQHALGPRLWAAVFLHDLARRHDGVCHRHGADAAQRLRDEPELRARLAEAGLAETDHGAIGAAVTAHSAPKEVSRDHEHWPLIALLKDADGLDRVRLGDLDPRYLRNAAAPGMVDFAQQLFDETNHRVPTGPSHFADVWKVVQRLESGLVRERP